MSSFIHTLVSEHENVMREMRVWHDQHGRLYGCGPDLGRKADLLRAVIKGYGYDIDGNFDALAAVKLEIPLCFWPEKQREEYWLTNAEGQ